MEQWFKTSPDIALEIIASSIFIYVAVIVYTRIFGKRSFSKMSSFDFAMTVATGSLIATTILSPSTSIMDGTIGIFMVYVLQLSAAYFRRYKFFRKAIDNTPLLLMDGETILYDNLLKARVTVGDLRSKLRQANVIRLSQIQAVTFETTGDIVVMHSQKEKITVEPWLLEDVNKK